MRRWLVVVGGLGVAVALFLLFRPDTLFTDVSADESLDQAFATTTTDATATTVVVTTSSGDVEGSTPVPVTTSTAPPAPQPAVLTTGQFVGVDHRAAGTATVYEQDGTHVLRFEDDTDIQNGPDLWVWLLPASSYSGGSPEEYIDLGTLKGTVGGQNYELPAEFDPGLHRSVLIWCLRFQVPFANAPLDG